MTLLDYIRQSGVASTKELMELKRDDPKGFDTIKSWAKEQAANQGVVLEEKA